MAAMHRPVSLLFVWALLISVVSFLLWLPHWELFGSEGNWGLLIPVFVVGFFVTFISGLMLLSLGLQAAFRRLRGSRDSHAAE